MKYTLDPLFSKYIRMKEASNGYVRCVTCGKLDKWQDADAGHYVSRDKWATKYDERNCHCQCKSCNRFKSGAGADYAVFLVSEYGQDVLLALVQKGREYKKCVSKTGYSNIKE